ANSCQQSITVVDNLAPVISACVPDLTVEVQSTGCQAVVAWSAVLASDNCGVPTQVFSISPGSVFDLGTTAVTVLVSDASLNASTCTFQVTVTDTQAPVWSNCPSNSSITLLDCGDVAVGDWVPPTASDICQFSASSNFVPGDILPVGLNTIVYTATDQSGNSSNCVFEVNVAALLALDCPSDIVVNVEPGQSSSQVSWNAPPGATNCTVCASTSIPGFEFLGEKTGHRYYVYLGGQVAWQEAAALASQSGGYLAAISDAAENELLRKEFPAFLQSAWIGLSDEAVEAQFAWSNGETAGFFNWPNGIVPLNDQLDFVALRNDGTWVDAAATDLHTFLMEVPCYALDVQSNNPAAFDNMVFPIGSTTVSYEVTDNCGNICNCSFQVQVVENQQVATCASVGDSNFGWIENVETEGFSNSSGDDGGRGNYTNSVFQLPDPGCVLRLTPGGPAVDKYLYWRVWADLNMDGDFFDANEVLSSMEGIGVQEFCYDVLNNLPTGPVGLRIAMSRWDYAEACGSFLAGEAEDYTVDFVDSSLYHAGQCDWSFGILGGNVAGLAVKLNWLGDGNCDVQKFQVERSSDGLDYELAGEVLPRPGNQLPVLYEFEDKTPNYGTNFYRIRVVFNDSTEVVSNLVEADFNADLGEVFLYPNPATTEAILHVMPYSGKSVRIFIANASGQMVLDKFIEVLENEPIKLDLNGYATGVYTLYLKADLERELVRRFVVSTR
ncbi:MAG: HYR domain-containing protein, partial [Saprospiraceae bacterium]|nr:HYR domain-containing protein [Saprospiraceae bacterium]